MIKVLFNIQNFYVTNLFKSFIFKFFNKEDTKQIFKIILSHTFV